MKIDLGEGQGPTWSIEPVERKGGGSLHIRAMPFCTEVAERIKWRSVVLSPVSDLNFLLALSSGDRDQMEPMG